MSNRVIAQADLSHIASRLRELGEYIDSTNSNVVAVGRNVEDLRGDLEELTEDFHAFVESHRLASRAQLAETRLVKLRQELEQKYGHYAVIRRTTKGILQANDLALVRQETIRSRASSRTLTRRSSPFVPPPLLSSWWSMRAAMGVPMKTAHWSRGAMSTLPRITERERRGSSRHPCTNR